MSFVCHLLYTPSFSLAYLSIIKPILTFVWKCAEPCSRETQSVSGTAFVAHLGSTMEKISLWAKRLITENIKHQLNQKNNPVDVCTDLAQVGTLCICVYLKGWKRRRNRHIHVFSNIQDKYSTWEFKFWLAC